MNVTVQDSWVNSKEVFNEFKIKTVKKIPNERYDGIVIAVGHDNYLDLDISLLKKTRCVVYDVKGILPKYSDISL